VDATDAIPRQVARALLEADAVRIDPTAPVTLASGLRSPIYVDGRHLPFHPPAWHRVIEACASRLRDAPIEAEVISGVEAAGIPHSSALAWLVGRPSVFVRKQAKDHGLGRRVEGGSVDGRRVLLVEDMVTTGGSSLAAIEALRAEGAVVDDCLAIVSYAFPESLARFEDARVRLHLLTTVEVIVREATETGRLDAERAAIVEAWLADPHAWDGPG
jgi:orotate phosphoribosyltransferase